MAGTINICKLKTIQVYSGRGSISDQNKLKQQVPRQLCRYNIFTLASSSKIKPMCYFFNFNT